MKLKVKVTCIYEADIALCHSTITILLQRYVAHYYFPVVHLMMVAEIFIDYFIRFTLKV